LISIIRDIPIYYEEFGEGKPIINIHGGGPDHRMMRGAFEPVFEHTQGYRRIYLDLPSFGKTPTARWMRNSDDMLDIVCDFINAVIGQEHFLLTGCSYGGWLSLGIIHKMSEKVDGVLLLVAKADSESSVNNPTNLPKKRIMWQSEHLALVKQNSTLKSYMDMAVVATPEMFDKWQNDIQPGLDIADNFIDYSMMEYSSGLEEAIRSMTFDKPSCILAGRQDDIPDCSYVTAYRLVDRFSRATFAALDCAGHILHIDNEPLFQQLVKDWIWRAELDSSTSKLSL